MVTPLVRRALLALGLGVVTYAGLSVLADQVVSAVRDNYGSLSGVSIQILNLLGVGEALGIVLSAIVARATFAAVARIGVVSS